MADRGFDARLADELADDFEALKAELRKAMTSTVTARIGDQPCEKCGCKHIRYVEVKDYKTMLAIAEWWSNRGFGRPGQAAGDESGERITVVYETGYRIAEAKRAFVAAAGEERAQEFVRALEEQAKHRGERAAA